LLPVRLRSKNSVSIPSLKGEIQNQY